MAALTGLEPVVINATPSATFFSRVGESRIVAAAQPPAPSYGSLMSEQESNRMDHSDEPETRYRHIQQPKCIVLKPFQEILLSKWH